MNLMKGRKVAASIPFLLGLVIVAGIIFVAAPAATTTENSERYSSDKNIETTNILDSIDEDDFGITADIKANKAMLVGAEDSVEESTEESTEPETETQQPSPSPYENKFMVNVNEYLNIRSEASEGAEVVGKLYAGSGGDIIEKGEQWTYISSGTVQGYVSNEFILTGADAENKANEVGTLTAIVTEDNIRIRETPDESGRIYGLADINDEYVCQSQQPGWVQVEYDGGSAYISADYVSVEMKIKKAVSIEEEQARIAAEARAQQKTIQEERFEESVQTVETESYDVSYDDAYLLACLVNAEAGSEPYEGKLAVANVVLNRLRSGRYGSTISDVINAPGQFSVVRLGTFAAALSSGPNSQSVQAANEALSGSNNVPYYSSFCSLSHANYGGYNSYTVIGNQVFYN